MTYCNSTPVNKIKSTFIYHNHVTNGFLDPVVACQSVSYILGLQRRVFSQFLIQFVHQVTVRVDISAEGLEFLQFGLLFR